MGHGRPLALRCCLRGSGSHEDPSIPSEFWESKDLLLVGPGPAGLAVLPDPRCPTPHACPQRVSSGLAGGAGLDVSADHGSASLSVHGRTWAGL